MDPYRRDVEFFFEKLRLLGKLHDYDVDGRSDFLSFHAVLEKLTFTNDSVSFNIMEIIQRVYFFPIPIVSDFSSLLMRYIF